MADPGPEFGDHVVSTEHEFITGVWGAKPRSSGVEGQSPLVRRSRGEGSLKLTAEVWGKASIQRGLRLEPLVRRSRGEGSLKLTARVWGQSLHPAGSEARAPGQVVTGVTGRRFPEADRLLHYHNLWSRPICPKSVFAKQKISSDVWGPMARTGPWIR